MSSTGSILDLDISDLEDAESLSQSALLKQSQRQEERNTTPQESAKSPPPPLPPPPKSSRSIISVVTNKNPHRMTELLSDAGLGVNRVVAVTPTVPQNQYWMIPGAIFDD